MSIDQQVNGIANQYRQNPQGLQQKYSQNKQLVDLLALQKLKSEKEQAAREMQMQMSPEPQTIAQQREQEVLGLTRNEIAQQVGSTMKQQEMERQKRMRAMQGMPKGIAAAMPPRPQPQRGMAGGGLVALSGGGGTTEERMKAAYDKAIAEGKTPEEAREIAKQAVNPYRESGVTELVEQLKQAPEGDNRVTYGPAKPQPEDFKRADALQKTVAEKAPSFTPAALGPVGIASQLGAIAAPKIVEGFQYDPMGYRESGAQQPTPAGNTPPFYMDPKSKGMPNPVEQMGIMATAAPKESEPTVVPETEDSAATNKTTMSAFQSDPQFRADVKGEVRGIMDIDPTAMEAQRRAGYESDMGDFKRGLGSLQRQRNDYRDLLSTQQDPRKLQRERVMQTLAGMAATGGTTFGAAAAGGAPGYLNATRRQEREQREGRDRLNEMLRTEVEGSRIYGEGINQAGVTGYDTAMSNKVAGVDAGTRIANTELLSQINSENNRVQAEANQLLRSGQLDARNAAVLTDTVQQAIALDEAVEEQLQLDTNYLKYSTVLSDENATQEERNAALDQINLLRQSVRKNMNYGERMQQINEIVNRMKQSLGIPVIDPGSSGGISVRRIK